MVFGDQYQFRRFANKLAPYLTRLILPFQSHEAQKCPYAEADIHTSQWINTTKLRDPCLQGPIRLARSDGCICNENEPDNYSTLLIYDTGYWRIIFWPCGLSTALTALTLKKLPFLWKIYPKTNTVLGIGTVMYKLKAANWDELLVPGLSYYLPECDVRLMSPQSTTNCIVDGDKVDWRLNKQVDMDMYIVLRFQWIRIQICKWCAMSLVPMRNILLLVIGTHFP